MRRFLLLLIIPAAMAVATAARATVHTGAAAALSSAHTLMSEHRYDSALTLLHPLAMSYDPQAPGPARLQSLDALYACADAALRLSRFPAALEYIFVTQRVIDSDPSLPKARLHLLYNNIYMVLGSQCAKMSYFEHALPHTLKAFDLSISENDAETTYRAFVDLAVMCQTIGSFDAIEEPERRLRELQRRHNEPLFASALANARGRRHNAAGNSAEASRCFTEALSLLPPGKYTDRYRANLLRSRAMTASPKETDAAVADLEEALAIADRYGMKSLRLSILGTMRYLVDNNGSISADDPRFAGALKDYDALRDSLKAYSIADNILDFESIRERGQLEERLNTSIVRSRILLWGGAGALVVALIAAGFLILLRRKNRQLQRRSMMLRQRVRELYSASKSAGPTSARPPQDSATDAGETDGGRGRPAYAVSPDERAAIADGIRKALDAGDAFLPDFSLTSLAVSLGRHPKAVSQVIRDEFGCTFPALVNRTRILEACRRIDSPEYDRLTNEAIGKSVGFNSRSAFNANFRRITGLTTTEYRRAGRRADDRADGSADNPA